MSLYNASGQINTTVVNGSSYTGLYAADGSYNIVVNASSSYVGLYHPCGALNAFVVTSVTTFQAANGSINVISNGSGGYYVALPTGSGLDLSQFLFYSAFPGAANTLINGFTAEKGGTFSTTGTGALNLKLTGTGGAQMSNNTSVAYAYNSTPLPVQPQWLSCQFKFTTTVDTITAFASMTDTTFNVGKALHCATALNAGLTTWSVTLLDEAAATFTQPAWNLNAAGYALLLNEQYTADLYFQNSNTKITLKDHTGSVVMTESMYDPDISTFYGLYFFFEHVNTTSLVTNKISLKSSLPNGFTFPTITPFNPNGASGWSSITSFVNSPFGGTATQGSGKVTIAGTTFGAGGMTSLGSLTTSDHVWFSIDASNFSGTTDNRFYVTMTDGSGATSNIITCTSNGRFQGLLTPTTNNTQNFLICATNLVGDPTFSVDISTKFLLVKNPPTTP